jgi:hypothetical protein
MIILNQSDGMKMIFNEVPIISFKKDKNIKDNYRFTESTTYSLMERKANVRNVGAGEMTVEIRSCNITSRSLIIALLLESNTTTVQI